MALNDTIIKAAKPQERNWKLADEKGLYLLVTPAGGKLWRLKFRHLGKEKKLALGAYPEISLAKARKLRDAAREQLADGQDPALERKRAKFTAKLSAAVTFAAVAKEYIDSKMIGDGKAEATISKARWFLEQLEPAIGAMPLADVDPQMLLAALKRLEAKGRHETAKKCRSFASRVFRYGVATGRCKSDPAQLLQGALIAPKARHYAAILEPAKLGELLRAIEVFSGSPVTMAALRIPATSEAAPARGDNATLIQLPRDGRKRRSAALPNICDHRGQVGSSRRSVGLHSLDCAIAPASRLPTASRPDLRKN